MVLPLPLSAILLRLSFDALVVCNRVGKSTRKVMTMQRRTAIGRTNDDNNIIIDDDDDDDDDYDVGIGDW